MIELSLQTTLAQTSRVLVGRGLISGAAAVLEEVAAPPCRVAVISDRNVASFWMEPLEAALGGAGYEVKSILVPPGEESKSLQMLGNLWDRLLASGLERGSVIVALGGGVVGDLAGMAAATALRGMPLVQVPTTLLAQVDAAVGGKNGINRSAGKNLVGTFWQPVAVLVDPAVLETLPEPEFRSGLAEVVKYGMIRGPSLLQDLARAGSLEALRADPEQVERVIRECVSIKVAIVGRDPRESGERAHLNFGHTVGHAIEAAEHFAGLSHGEAVAVGMVAASFLAVDLGLAAPELPSDLAQLLHRFGLPVGTAVAPGELLPLLAQDKKRAGGKGRWVLVRRPGEVQVVTAPEESRVLRALEAVHQPPPEDPGTGSAGGT